MNTRFKVVAAAVLSIPAAALSRLDIAIALGAELGGTKTVQYHEQIGFAVLAVTWLSLTCWAAFGNSNNQIVHRCSIGFSLAAFALPVAAIAFVIIQPPARDPIFPEWMIIAAAGVVGITLGIGGAAAARATSDAKSKRKVVRPRQSHQDIPRENPPGGFI